MATLGEGIYDDDQQEGDEDTDDGDCEFSGHKGDSKLHKGTFGRCRKREPEETTL